MTPEVRTPEEAKKLEADKARALAARAEGLYKARNRIAFLVNQLEARDLFRLRDLLDRLTPEDFRALARYAEGLADWPDPEASSSNGEKST